MTINRRTFGLAAIAALATSRLQSDDQPRKPPQRLPLPHDGVLQAAADLARLPILDQPHQWYIWFQDAAQDRYRLAYQLALNLGTSRAQFVAKATPVGPNLLRLDKRVWFPDQPTPQEAAVGITPPRIAFEQILGTYIDPTFYVDAAKTAADIVTAQAVKLIAPGSQTVLASIAAGTPVTPLGPTSGRLSWVQYRNLKGWLPTASIQQRTPGIGGVFSPAIRAYGDVERAANYLQQAAGAVPIVEADRWLVHSLRATKGGLYYKLQGLVSPDGRRRVTLDQYFSLFGANEAAAEALNGNDFVPVFRSQITGVSRRIVAFFGRATRPSQGAPLITWTQDVAADNIVPAKGPIYNLFPGVFKPDGSEIIATKSTGLPSYTLWNGRNELQDFATDNIASDHRIPDPHRKRLTPGISCIRCHEDGYRDAPSGIQQIANSRGDGTTPVLLTDLAELAKGRTLEEISAEFIEKYSGDTAAALDNARDAYALIVKRMTRPTPHAEGLEVTEAHGLISQAYQRYEFDPIDPIEVMRRLGYVCETNADALELFGRVVPKESPESTSVATIRAYQPGIPQTTVTREYFEDVYQPLLSRSMQNR